MISYEKAVEYAKSKYPMDKDVSKRITDKDFAYDISEQPEKYFETGNMSDMVLGSGGQLVIKETGEVFGFSSAPMFLPIFKAKTLAEFNQAKLEFEKEHGPYQPNEVLQ